MDYCYIENSGFLMRQDHELVLIDCMKKLPENIAAGFDSSYKLTVLASHFHSDHFSTSIFDLRHRQPDTQYILSSDIMQRRKRNIPQDAHVNSVEKGQSVIANGIHITAWGSTDIGVSFHLDWGGKQIFHAGDLNYWHWKDESTPEGIQRAEHAFERELEEIANGIPALDLAFFPVDPRMGSDYFRGAVRFAQVMRPKVFVPMHFGYRLNAPQAFYDEMDPLTQVIRTAEGWRTLP